MHRFREQETESPLRRFPVVESAAGEEVHTNEETTSLEAASSGAARAGFWRSLRSENPVLHKELRSIFSPAKQTQTQRKLQQSVGGTVALAIYAAVLLGMREVLKTVPSESQHYAWYVLYGILIGLQGLILIIAPLSRLPGMISREREKQTWNALLLSRLSPETILSGKYAAGLTASLGVLLFFLPLTGLAAVLGQVAPGNIVMGALVLLATAGLLSMTSLYASWKQETSVKANNQAGLAMLSIVFGAAGVWGLGSLLWSVAVYLMTGGNIGTAMPDLLRMLLMAPAWLNPFVALYFASAPIIPGEPWLPIVHRLLPLVYLIFSTGLSVRLWKKMTKSFWDAPRDFTG
jgi:hypothetical protein